jgi:hypothetical protein
MHTIIEREGMRNGRTSSASRALIVRIASTDGAKSQITIESITPVAREARDDRAS